MIQRLAEHVAFWLVSRRELHRALIRARDGQRAAEAVAAAMLADNVTLQRRLQETDLEQVR